MSRSDVQDGLAPEICLEYVDAVVRSDPSGALMVLLVGLIALILVYRLWARGTQERRRVARVYPSAVALVHPPEPPPERASPQGAAPSRPRAVVIHQGAMERVCRFCGLSLTHYDHGSCKRGHLDD